MPWCVDAGPGTDSSVLPAAPSEASNAPGLTVVLLSATAPGGHAAHPFGTSGGELEPSTHFFLSRLGPSLHREVDDWSNGSRPPSSGDRRRPGEGHQGAAGRPPAPAGPGQKKPHAGRSPFGAARSLR